MLKDGIIDYITILATNTQHRILFLHWLQQKPNIINIRTHQLLADERLQTTKCSGFLGIKCTELTVKSAVEIPPKDLKEFTHSVVYNNMESFYGEKKSRKSRKE
uniref:Uncharacterized protein n=1 Tax=Romanomermis culicivorax TaxID=13658 RepID=A0A915IJ40_ROMCU